MAVRSVLIGHAFRPVDISAFRSARKGVSLSRPTLDEFALANKLLGAFPGSQMVKFGKNGSDATAAAVRLARSATGRDLVLRSAEAPFLGVHDWFIGSTAMDAGVPERVQDLTKVFQYGNLKDLEDKLIAARGSVAAVILEPLGQAEPSSEYLAEVKRLVHEHGTLLVFDEVVSGFRLTAGGYQSIAGVTPDLTAVGKALANGYPLSALIGAREIMELGGVLHDRRRTFIMSSTYGPERSAIGAANAAMNYLSRGNPYQRLERNVRQLTSGLEQIFAEAGLAENLEVTGAPGSPNVSFKDSDGGQSLSLKTIFMEEMAVRGILLGAHLFSPSLAHGPREVKVTLAAAKASVASFAPVVRGKTDEQLKSELPFTVKPVFRPFN